MENDFCRLLVIQPSGRQFLIMREFDSSEDRHKLTCIWSQDGVRVNFSMGFRDEAQRDKAFREMHEGQAAVFMHQFEGMASEEEE